MRRICAYLALTFMLLLAVACSPVEQPLKERTQAPVMGKSRVTVGDGAEFPYREWKVKKPQAVILALHGFNDYSRAFELFATDMQTRNITTVAFDQRGFGEGPEPGIWGGSDNIAYDACDVLRAVRKKHKHQPLFLLGESMGGAVVLRVHQRCMPEDIKGLILVAPAIWGGEMMSPFYRTILWTMAHIAPGLKLTGDSLHIQTTDNMEIAREMAYDPYVIKATRVDALYGLMDLMDAAHDGLGSAKPLPALLLYGFKDEVIPIHSIRDIQRRMPYVERVNYEHGYHMLLRDMQRARVYDDVSQWIKDTSHAE